jgi:DHA2 family multidrug resistance protein
MVMGFALYASVFALPVFLQGILGYSAWDTGRVILPGALASAVTMAVMGRLGAKIDARIPIVTGVFLFAASMWLHSHFTAEIGMHDLFWPMILRGVGLGCIFVPLTGVAVARLKPQNIPQGTGLYNLSRQLGGSFGIAIVATLITRFREQSRQALLPHMSGNEPSVRAFLDNITLRVQSLGGTAADAQLRAEQLLSLRLLQQASVIAYEKVFFIMGITFICALPLLLLLKTGRVQGGGGAAH